MVGIGGGIPFLRAQRKTEEGRETDRENGIPGGRFAGVRRGESQGALEGPQRKGPGDQPAESERGRGEHPLRRNGGYGAAHIPRAIPRGTRLQIDEGRDVHEEGVHPETLEGERDDVRDLDSHHAHRPCGPCSQEGRRRYHFLGFRETFRLPHPRQGSRIG